MNNENFVECDVCKKQFKNKYIANSHKKKSKTCLAIQGETSSIECDFCLRKLSTRESLTSHLKICKEKNKAETEKEKKEYEKKLNIQKREFEAKIKDLEDKLRTQKNEYDEKFEIHKQENKKLEEKYEDKLEKQKQESRQELEKQKQEYEEKLEKEREVLRQIAMKPTTTNIRDTKNTTINNMNTLNFGDKEKLNRVIRNNINEKVVEQGQVGIAGVVYNNYLKDENGNQMYILLDAARQHFQFRDKDGNLVTDVGAKILTDAVAASNLERETAKIARDIPDLYDHKNKDKFESVMSLTGEFKKDNSTFRKEIVHLAKKDQKVKKEKGDKEK